MEGGGLGDFFSVSKGIIPTCLPLFLYLIDSAFMVKFAKPFLWLKFAVVFNVPSFPYLIDSASVVEICCGFLTFAFVLTL